MFLALWATEPIHLCSTFFFAVEVTIPENIKAFGKKVNDGHLRR
jgi:hypothetical protein